MGTRDGDLADDGVFAATIIAAVLGGFAVVVGFVLLWRACRRTGGYFHRDGIASVAAAHAPTVRPLPSAGTYTAPLGVELEYDGAGADTDILVRIVRQGGASGHKALTSMVVAPPTAATLPLTPGAPSVDVSAIGARAGLTVVPPPPVATPTLAAIPAPGATSGFDKAGTGSDAIERGFALYRDPLYFDVPGVYDVAAYAAGAHDAWRSPMGEFRFVVVAGPAAASPRSLRRPLPLGARLTPSIIPESGDVTDRTFVTIYAAPTPFGNSGLGLSGHSSAPSVVYFSTDGGPPDKPYGGPFRLQTGANGAARDVVVRAVSVAADGAPSGEAAALLRVVSGQTALFLASVPEPSAVVEARRPMLHMSHPRMSDVSIQYVLRCLHDPMPSGGDRSGDDGNGDGVHGNAVKSYGAYSIPLGDDVVEVRAWAVDRKRDVESAPCLYDVAARSMRPPPAAHTASAIAAARAHANAFAPAGDATARPRGRPVDTTLAPPSIYVNCTAVAVRFDVVQGYEVRYTLDGIDPAPDNPLALSYQGGAVPMHPSGGGSVPLIARYFRTDATTGDVVYGRPLRRLFHVNQA